MNQSPYRSPEHYLVFNLLRNYENLYSWSHLLTYYVSILPEFRVQSVVSAYRSVNDSSNSLQKDSPEVVALYSLLTTMKREIECLNAFAEEVTMLGESTTRHSIEYPSGYSTTEQQAQKILANWPTNIWPGVSAALSLLSGRGSDDDV